jgi:hypothetical protein
MGVLGCLIPIVLTLIGGGIGGLWGGTHDGLWGAVAGFVIGLIAMFVALWWFARARSGLAE